MKIYKSILGWLLIVLLGFILGNFIYYLTSKKNFNFLSYINRSFFTDLHPKKSANPESEELSKYLEYSDSDTGLSFLIPNDLMVLTENASNLINTEKVKIKKQRFIQKKATSAVPYDLYIYIASHNSNQALSISEQQSIKNAIKKGVMGISSSGKIEESLFDKNLVTKTKYTNASWNSDLTTYELFIGGIYILLYQKIDPEYEVFSSYNLTQLIQSIKINSKESEADSAQSINPSRSVLLDGQLEI